MTLEPASAEPVAPASVALAPDAPVTREKTRVDLFRAVLEVLHDLSIAVLVCFFLVTFVAQAFRVQGTSMQPLLADGERIIVNKLLYRFGPIQRGDVVVFWYPKDPAVSFIKRVAGRPGDTVEIRRGQLFVNGQRVREDYVLGTYRDADTLPPVVVPPGYYYVLGDHRTSSNDSRTWGEVPERYIYGKAWFRFWPLSKLGPIR
ncbi:MAG TPA: signal peptidase I [Vicinamibacteria bacterium]|nr:signal peptidase I [Vicinamibacteria bacterium]